MVHAVPTWMQETRQLDGNIDRGSVGKYFVRAAKWKILRVTSESDRLEWIDIDGIDQIHARRYNRQNEVHLGLIIDSVLRKTFFACATGLNRKFGEVQVRGMRARKLRCVFGKALGGRLAKFLVNFPSSVYRTVEVDELSRLPSTLM